jgi:hypothetical protein
MPYMQDSMELNLFFLRILKEHALFMQLSFTPKDKTLADKAADLGGRLTELLRQAMVLSKGYISEAIMTSGELFTRFTEEAERQTQYFTGVPIDTQLTRDEYDLGGTMTPLPSMKPEVDRFNQNALALAREMLQFNQNVLEDVAACRVFTTNYPTMLDHLAHETQHYIFMLSTLVSGDTELGPREFAEEQAFWNNIMAEHAMFINGLLDPSEAPLKADAQAFAAEFERLVRQADAAEKRLALLPQVTARSEAATRRIHDFKMQGAKGLLSCSIRAIIPPLLSDHVLREANHYLRVLRENMRS